MVESVVGSPGPVVGTIGPVVGSEVGPDGGSLELDSIAVVPSSVSP